MANDHAFSNGTNGHGINGHGHKKLILNAVVNMSSSQQSPGLWRHPDDQSWRFADLEGWTKLATELEAASFHGIFIDDALGGIDTYRSLVSAVRTAAHWPVHEPLSLVSAMAAVTKSIGFSVTASTIHEEPYHLARRLSTVDHLSKGRLGWNVAIEQRNSASHNLGSERMTPEDAYARSEEYMRVVYKLVESSWRTDGVVFQRDKGVYAAPCLVREINHKGKYFDVPGPHMCHPSPQRTPIISQSPLILRPDVSGFAIDFAAKHAEVVVVSGLTPESVAGNVKDIRRIAKEKHGRDPQSIKILATATVVVGASEQEAKAKLTDYRQYGSLEGARVLFSDHTGIDVSKWGDEEDLRQVDSPVIKSYIDAYSRLVTEERPWTKHVLAEHYNIGGGAALLVGDPSQVADGLEAWVRDADVDGFNLAYMILPQSFSDITTLLVPELQRRGLFWNKYAHPGGTYRENLMGSDVEHPAAKYRWQAPQMARDFPVPE